MQSRCDLARLHEAGIRALLRAFGARAYLVIVTALAAMSSAHAVSAAGPATVPRAGVPAAPVAPPYILADLQSFHGRIDYRAHRLGGASEQITGTAVISANSWSVDERAAGYAFHADSNGASVMIGTVQARNADPLNADSLANAWMVALGELASARLTPRPRSTTAWSTPQGVVIYTDDAQSAILGLVDRMASTSPSFMFENWQRVSGVSVPQRILRLRSGVNDAAFSIDSYAVSRTIDPVNGAGIVAHAPAATDVSKSALAFMLTRRESPAFPWPQVLLAFGALALSVLVVAWTRRDALLSRYCLWLAQDPRAWREVGTSIFVSAEGLMYYNDSIYRVGPQFYARNVLVQRSPLFLRISAPNVTKAVVLPRKFRPSAQRGLAAARARAGGFSLAEMLVATSLFALVVVAGVFPALIAVARSNAVAAAHRAALAAAANALADQESATAYGTTIVDGTTTTVIDGQTISVDVHPSASAAAAHDIVITVTDSTGTSLARVATTVGPPVPVPGSQTTPVGPTGGWGTPSPSPSGGWGTPNPSPSGWGSPSPGASPTP